MRNPTAKFWLIGEELAVVGKPVVTGGCTVEIDHALATELAKACPVGSHRRGYWEGVSAVLSVTTERTQECADAYTKGYFG